MPPSLIGYRLHHCRLLYHLLRHKALLAAEYFKLMFERNMALVLQMDDLISTVQLPIPCVRSCGCTEWSIGPNGRSDGANKSGFEKAGYSPLAKVVCCYHKTCNSHLLQYLGCTRLDGGDNSCSNPDSRRAVHQRFSDISSYDRKSGCQRMDKTCFKVHHTIENASCGNQRDRLTS